MQFRDMFPDYDSEQNERVIKQIQNIIDTMDRATLNQIVSGLIVLATMGIETSAVMRMTQKMHRRGKQEPDYEEKILSIPQNRALAMALDFLDDIDNQVKESEERIQREKNERN